MTPADHEALVKRLRDGVAKFSQQVGSADEDVAFFLTDVSSAATALERLAPVTMTEGQISAAYHRFVTGDEATQHERFRAALVALPNMADGVREILQTIVDEMEGCRDGKCDDHVVRFGHDALVAAQSALAAAPPPTSQWQTMERALRRAQVYVDNDAEWFKIKHPGDDAADVLDVQKMVRDALALPAPPTEQDKP